MKNLNKLTRAAALAILTLASISCASLRQKETPQRASLELVFPAFPDPEENGESAVTYNAETDEVIMPLWYFKKITRYAVYVDECEAIYEAWKGAE